MGGSCGSGGFSQLASSTFCHRTTFLLSLWICYVNEMYFICIFLSYKVKLTFAENWFLCLNSLKHYFRKCYVHAGKLSHLPSYGPLMHKRDVLKHRAVLALICTVLFQNHNNKSQEDNKSFGFIRCKINLTFHVWCVI